MKDKYYKPVIEDFITGFAFQIQTNLKPLTKELVWANWVFNEKTNLEAIKVNLDLNRIRVKVK